MVKETAEQEFLLITVVLFTFEHYVILVQQILLSTIISFELYYTGIELWVAGEGPTIELSYLPRKIMREKRLSF